MKRKPPTRKDLEKWLKNHGHKQIDIDKVKDKSTLKDAVIKLHKNKRKVE